METSARGILGILLVALRSLQSEQARWRARRMAARLLEPWHLSASSLDLAFGCRPTLPRVTLGLAEGTSLGLRQRAPSLALGPASRPQPLLLPELGF